MKKANMVGVHADEIDLALYADRCGPDADGSIDSRAFLTADADWWRQDVQDVMRWLIDETGLKFCTKCECVLVDPQLGDDEPERCAACGDDASVPACAASMGCLCAFHARGGDVDGGCDTSERSDAVPEPIVNPELHECLRLVLEAWQASTPGYAGPLVERAQRALDDNKPRSCLQCAADLRQGGSIEKAVRDALQGTMDDRCDDGKCPGWSIFNESTGNPEIQRCDDCCPEHLTDDDVATLREARVALCEAWVRVLDGEGGPLPRLRQRYGFGWKLRVLTHPTEYPELVLLAATGETLIQDFEPKAIDAFLEGVESVVNHIPRLPGR